MRAAINFATTSPDPSTQNSAVLVLANGDAIPETLSVNCFPKGVVESENRWKRPAKYEYVEHAERNAIYAAARQGISTYGLTLLSPWASCTDCARAIIQAGITRLVRYISIDHLHWGDSVLVADKMMTEAGVEIITLKKPIEGCPSILRNGKPWFPNGEQEDSPEGYNHPLN